MLGLGEDTALTTVDVEDNKDLLSEFSAFEDDFEGDVTTQTPDAAANASTFRRKKGGCLPDQRSHGLLYVSAFLGAWGDRMWEFAVALFLMDIQRDTLMLAAGFGAVTECSTILFGPSLGAWVDSNGRMHVARRSLVAQNLGVAASAGLIFLVLYNFVEPHDDHVHSPNGAHMDDGGTINWTTYDACAPTGEQHEQPDITGMRWEVALLVVLINACAIVSQLASTALKVAIQKDWVVVIAGGEQDVLSGLNASVRRIDLLCKVLSPTVVGFLYTFVGARFTAAFIAIWNVCSMFVEYQMLRLVYSSTPALADKKGARDVSGGRSEGGEAYGDESSAVRERSVSATTRKINVMASAAAAAHKSGGGGGGGGGVTARICEFFTEFKSGWSCYAKQSTVRPAVGLALLYLSSIQFGVLMTGYLKWRGLEESWIGLFRGFGALFGLTATIMYKWHVSRFGLSATALRASWFQVAMCVLCCFSFLVNDLWASVGLLCAGVIVSRIGVWSFDICVSQMQQEDVVPGERGVVGSVQNSLQSIMWVLHYLMAMVFHCPAQFNIIVIVSTVAVGACATLYTTYHCGTSGHAYSDYERPPSGVARRRGNKKKHRIGGLPRAGDLSSNNSSSLLLDVEGNNI